MHRNEFEARINARANKDAAFKQELLANPKGVLARELGGEIPAHVKVNVVVETADTVYLVLRAPPVGAKGELADAELDAVAGGTATVHAVLGESVAQAYHIGGGGRAGQMLIE